MKNFSAIVLVTLFVIGIDAFWGCRAAEQSIPDSRLKTAVAGQLGNHTRWLYNGSRTHVLCIADEKTEENGKHNILRYGLYDAASAELLDAGEYADGTVEWKNDTTIVIVLNPGMVTDNEEHNSTLYGYTFNTITRKRGPR